MAKSAYSGPWLSPGTQCRVQAFTGRCAAHVRVLREAGTPGASRGRVQGTTVGGRSGQSRVSTGTFAMQPKPSATTP